MGILKSIYHFIKSEDLMKNTLGKQCCILHYNKNGNETHSTTIENGMFRFGDYKVWIFQGDELYYKGSTEDIHIVQSSDKIIISTNDRNDVFEILKK